MCFVACVQWIPRIHCGATPAYVLATNLTVHPFTHISFQALLKVRLQQRGAPTDEAFGTRRILDRSCLIDKIALKFNFAFSKEKRHEILAF